MAAELDAVLVDRAQSLEREDLEAAGVGEDGTIPSHERVQPPELSNELVGRAEMQMVRVAKDHLRADLAQIVRVKRLHGGERTDGHERGRIHGAVRRREPAGPRATLLTLDLEMKA